jgi:broad specificity phosphatase PhoE
MRWLLVTHAETDWVVQRRYQGYTDVPLNEHGRRQALSLARRLARERIAAVYASDLSRARDTALVIARPHDLTVRAEPRLRELHFGDWEGLTFEEIRMSRAPELSAWEADCLHGRPSEGETLVSLTTRLRTFLAEICRDHQEAGETVLLVAHRGSLRVLLCLALGFAVEMNWRFRLVPASLSELELGGEGAVLTRLNETHHLGEVEHAR